MIFPNTRNPSIYTIQLSCTLWNVDLCRPSKPRVKVPHFIVEISGSKLFASEISKIDEKILCSFLLFFIAICGKLIGKIETNAKKVKYE
jgi:hypothetical protein